MVAVWGAGGQGPSTTLVMLDHEGSIVDMMYSGQLSGSIRHPSELDGNYEWEKALGEPHKVSVPGHTGCMTQTAHMACFP